MTMWLNPRGSKYKNPFEEKAKLAKENIEYINPAPVFTTPVKSPPMSFSTNQLMPSHALAKSAPDYKSAFIKGTLGSLTGRALTPLAEKITGRKVDLSTLPEPETFGQKALSFGSGMVADLPLWIGGDALLAKPLGALAKTAPISRATGLLPKALTPALGTGVRAGTTYGLPINALETAMNKDGAEGFAERVKEAPLMALGGTVLHGAGQLALRGAKTGIDYSKFNKLTKLPEMKSNPLDDIQNAYRNPITKMDAQTNLLAQKQPSPNYKIKSTTTPQQRAYELRQSELNKVFKNLPIGSVDTPMARKTLQEGIDNSLGIGKRTKYEGLDAFGKPIKSYRKNTDIEEITTRMNKQVDDIETMIKQADEQTPIGSIRKKIKDMGGIKQANDGIFEERKVIPNWIRNDRAGRPLDEVSDTLGMSSDELLAAISDSAYKPKNYRAEAEALALRDPEYSALDNTLQMLKSELPGKRTLDTMPKLKRRELPPKPLTKTNFDEMAKSDDYFIRTVRTPSKDLAGRKSTPSGPLGIDMGLGTEAHSGITGFKLKDAPRLIEWMKREGWEHPNVAIYKGKYLGDGPHRLEAEFKADKLIGSMPVSAFKEANGDVFKALTKQGLTSGDVAKQQILSLSGTLPPNTPPKPKLNVPLKPRETKNTGRLTWTNKDKIPEQQPIRSEVPAEQPRAENNAGFAHEVIEPRIPMRLQTFNNSIPELPDTAKHIVTRTERQPINAEAIRTNAYIKTTDNLHRFNQLDKYVEGITGQKLSPQDKSYMLALNSKGTGSITSHILEENLVNSKGEVIGDSLKSITKKLKNKKVAKEFDDYLVNKHAITRMQLGEKVFPDEMNMTPGMSEAKVREYESIHPEFKELSTKLYEYQNKLSKAWLVDTGIVSPEAWGKWITENPHYVPNNRFFSELEKTPFNGTKRGFAGQSNPVKARTGSQRQIISPLEVIMEHTEQYVKVAKRNEVMQTIIRNLKKNPEEFKGWAEVIPDNKQLRQGFMDDINQVLERDGIDGVVESFNRQFDDVFNAKKQRLDLGNIVTGLIDGEKVHVKVNDPLLLDALTNLKPQAQQIVIAALGRVTSVMKNLTTGINPMFGLARNIWRDIPTAYINSKSTNNPFVFGKDLLGSIIDVAGNKELYKSYKAMGGGYASSSVSSSRNTLAESKARLLPGYAVKHPFKTALGGLERLNNTVETAPRLAEFKRISKAGDYSSKIKGLYEANDVTTNFSRTGNIIKEADSVMPYLNAAWQGIDKFRRTFLDNPVQASAKALTAVTFPSIMLYQLNHNNPAYQQLSDYIKDNNFLIPKSNGTFLKIPKPREIGVIFGSSVERAMRQWQDSDPDAFNRFMETVKTNFMPPTRSILAPLNDVRSNKDFMDRPIVSGSVSRLSPYLQFDEKTSEPAKMLGKAINKSPQNIDYLAKSYLGGVAQLGIPALTKNASVAGTLKKQVTADPVFSSDVLGDFYTTKNRIDTSASDSKATGDKSLEVGQQYKKLFNKTNDKLSDIRKEVDRIQASDLSREEKESRIRAYQIQMLKLAKETNDKFKAK